MEWEVELHVEIDRWFTFLCASDPVTADRVEEAIDTLAREGPTLGRPLVDRIKGGRLHNLKVAARVSWSNRDQDLVRLRSSATSDCRSRSNGTRST